jgi:ATP-dependent RNA helicase DDX46/PRP5
LDFVASQGIKSTGREREREREKRERERERERETEKREREKKIEKRERERVTSHAGDRPPRGGVTRQGVALTDLQSLLDGQ